MFPVTDFNFVVYGFATFAATVGYACARGLTSSPPRSSSDAPLADVPDASSSAASPSHAVHQEPTPVSHGPVVSPGEEAPDPQPEMGGAQAVSPLAEPTSPSRRLSAPLKRKRTEDDVGVVNPDAGYPHNLLSIYPNKRSRTPSSDSEDAQTHPELKSNQAEQPPAPVAISKRDAPAIVKHPIPPFHAQANRPNSPWSYKKPSPSSIELSHKVPLITLCHPYMYQKSWRCPPLPKPSLLVAKQPPPPPPPAQKLPLGPLADSQHSPVPARPSPAPSSPPRRHPRNSAGKTSRSGLRPRLRKATCCRRPRTRSEPVQGLAPVLSTAGAPEVRGRAWQSPWCRAMR